MGLLSLFTFTIVVQILMQQLLPSAKIQSGISMSHHYSCYPRPSGISGCLRTYSLVLPGLFTQGFPSFLSLHTDLFTLQLLYCSFIFLRNTAVPV